MTREYNNRLFLNFLRLFVFLLLGSFLFGGCRGNLMDTTYFKVENTISKYALIKAGVDLENYDLDSIERDDDYTFLSYKSSASRETVEITIDKFGGNGVARFYDPLIMQLPAHVWPTEGRYSCDQDELQEGFLVLKQVSSVPVTPLINIYPEPGCRLYIIDFPEDINAEPVDGKPRSFTTTLKLYDSDNAQGQQFPVKVITSGEFTVDGKTYYLPFYPVETDFAKIPPIMLGGIYDGLERDVPVPDMSAFPFPEILNYDLRTQATPLSRLYYPHVASDESWETEIAIINDDANSALAGTLVFYSNFAEVLGGLPLELPPHGRKKVVVGEIFPENADRIAYAVLEYRSENRVVGYSKYFIDGVSRTAVPALPDSEINQGEVFIPHIASSDEWETAISFVNTNDTDKTVRIETNTNLTISFEVGAGQRRYFTFAEMAPANYLPTLSSATITNGDGIIGVEIFGSTPSSVNKYLAGVLLRDDTATTMYYPHTVTDGLWWTGVVGYNPQDTKARVTVTPYSVTGEDLSAEFTGGELSIAGAEKYLGAVSALKFPPATAWFKLESTQPLTGFELFGKVNGTQLAGYTSCNIDTQNGIFPKLEKAGWTGIAFVNIGQNTTVTLKAYGDAGELVATSEPLELAANEKKVAVAQALFEADISQATYLTFSADAPIVGFQLNSSNDGMMLDGLPAL